MTDEQDRTAMQHEDAAALSDYLHDQADQMVGTAERLEDRAEAAHAEADQFEKQAGEIRDHAEALHQQADEIDRTFEQ